MSSGTKTWSNTTSQKSAVPSMNGIGVAWMPGALRSTISWVSPWRLSLDLVARRGAAQHDEPVVLVGRRGPDLRAVEHPAVAVARRLGGQRGEVAAAVGLAHPDAERQLAAGRSPGGTSASAPRCRTWRCTGPDWRSATQWWPTGAPQRSSSSTTMKRSTADAVVAAVRRGQGHPQPAPVAELARERGVLGRVHPEAGPERSAGQLLRPGTRAPRRCSSAFGRRQLDRLERDHLVRSAR